MGLPGLDRQSPVHDRAEWNLVQKSPIDSRNRDGPAISAGQNRLAQRGGPVRSQSEGLFEPIISSEEPVSMALHSHRIDAGVRPAPACEVLQRALDVDPLVVERLRPTVVSRLLQSFLETIDRDHALCSEDEGADDGKEAHRTAAPDSNRVTGLDATIFRGHVPSRENVGKKEDLLIGEMTGDFDRSDI